MTNEGRFFIIIGSLSAIDLFQCEKKTMLHFLCLIAEFDVLFFSENLIRRKCLLKNKIGRAKVKPGFLSGTKTNNFNGDLFQINYCRHVQKSKICPRQPKCNNVCPIGYETDDFDCITSCKCKDIRKKNHMVSFRIGILKDY